MVCCKCNKTGSCRACACVKAGNSCSNCLPGKHGHCVNSSTFGAINTAASSSVSNSTVNATLINSGVVQATPASHTCPASSPSNNTTSLPSIVPVSSCTPVPEQRQPALAPPDYLQPTPVLYDSTSGTSPLTRSAPPCDASSPPIAAVSSVPPADSSSQSPRATRTTSDTTHPSSQALSWPLPDQQPRNFHWGSLSGDQCLDQINAIYEEVIHWKPNLFLVPFGAAGTAFVNEFARLFQAFADGSSLECVCMKAITLLQSLILQKPSKKSKTKDHIALLKQRLDL